MKCDAKIRPLPNNTELECEEHHAEVAGDTLHKAVLRNYAHKGSITDIVWFESDRRTFRGDWEKCPTVCAFPVGHRGGHTP